MPKDNSLRDAEKHEIVETDPEVLERKKRSVKSGEGQNKAGVPEAEVPVAAPGKGSRKD
jgi:hypothetical protein